MTFEEALRAALDEGDEGSVAGCDICGESHVHFHEVDAYGPIPGLCDYCGFQIEGDCCGCFARMVGEDEAQVLGEVN